MSSSELTLSPDPIQSIPIRMPGQTLSVVSTVPSFQVTLRGQGDQEGVFEKNQEKGVWNSNTLHYTLGRIVYDFIFDANPVGNAITRPVEKDNTKIKLNVKYSQLGYRDMSTSNDEKTSMQIKEETSNSTSVVPRTPSATPSTAKKELALMLRLWEFEFNPSLWFKLPPVPQRFFGLRVHSPVRFNLAVAGVPVTILPTKSLPDEKFPDTCQVLDLGRVPTDEWAGVVVEKDGTKVWMKFETIFGAWLVFESNPFRKQESIRVEYIGD